jgi:hypothetical protein
MHRCSVSQQNIILFRREWLVEGMHMQLQGIVSLRHLRGVQLKSSSVANILANEQVRPDSGGYPRHQVAGSNAACWWFQEAVD